MTFAFLLAAIRVECLPYCKAQVAVSATRRNCMFLSAIYYLLCYLLKLTHTHTHTHFWV